MARAVVAHENRRAPTQTLRRRLSSLRGRLAVFFGNFSAPRFSPSLTALMVLIAVGVTAAVMSYLNPKEKPSLLADVSQSASAPSTSASATPDTFASSSPDTSDVEATSGEGSESKVNNKPQIAGNDSREKNRYALAAKKETTARFLRSRSPVERESSPDALIREAEQKYVAAINMLSRDLNRRRSRLDAETAAQFERTLVAVDRTIADTRRAARKHPNDPVAAKYVLTAYAKKVDVLREMIGY